MTDEDRAQWQKYRQELFNHFANEHDLHLLESEMDEIERIVARKPAEAFPKVDKAIAAYLETHLDVEHLESDAFAADICLLFAPAIAEVVAENERLKAGVKDATNFAEGVLEICPLLDDSDRHYTKHTQGHITRLETLLGEKGGQ